MEKAERMVRLQFDMEGLIYCQDKIYSAVLQDVRQEASQPLAKPAQTLPMAILGTPSNPSAVSCKTEIATHVEAYCLVSRPPHVTHSLPGNLGAAVNSVPLCGGR